MLNASLPTVCSLFSLCGMQMVDHLVAGSDAAKKYALANGYVLQSTLGMVIANFTAPPIPQAYDYYEVGDGNWKFSL